MNGSSFAPFAAPERKLLLAVAFAKPDAEVVEDVARLAAEVRSWDGLIAASAANQLRPQVASALKALGGGVAGAAAAVAELDTFASANRGHAKFLSAELARALEALASAGVQAMPFKGPAFATLVGTSPEAREMTDLDVLVDSRDLPRAAACLSALGFECPLPSHAVSSRWLAQATHELPIVRPGDALSIELHWRLGPAWFPAPICAEDAFGRATQRDFLDIQIWWPAAEELLLMHVADGMKSCGCGARWMADLVQIMRRHPGLDWDRIRGIARQRAGHGTLATAMAALETLLAEATHGIGGAALAFDLPQPARTLAEEARARPRLAAAAHAILARIGCDARETRASAHFRWALQVADDRLAIAGAVSRYLAGPAIPDLAAMNAPDEWGWSLRWRALRRRLGVASP